MLPSHGLLREQLAAVIADKRQQGHDVAGLVDDLQTLPDSYDAMAAFARRLANLPVRADWPYVEPSDLEGIWGNATHCARWDPSPRWTWRTPRGALKRLSWPRCVAAS